jgi:hypothetical protein
VIIRNHSTLIKILHTLNLISSTLFSTKMCLVPFKKKKSTIKSVGPLWFNGEFINLLYGDKQKIKTKHSLFNTSSPWQLLQLFKDNYYNYLKYTHVTHVSMSFY